MRAPLVGPELLAWLAAIPPAERDQAMEEHLGLAGPLPPSTSPGKNLIGHHTSSIAAIVRMAIEVPITADDVFIDLGAGFGKVVASVNLITGARCRGIELQPSLVDRARVETARLDGVSFTCDDARNADISDGTVFFLYLPFTGLVLRDVLVRVREVAARRDITIATLGLDLDRHARWLKRRPIESFWHAIYDSEEPGASKRASGAITPSKEAQAIAEEKSLSA